MKKLRVRWMPTLACAVFGILALHQLLGLAPVVCTQIGEVPAAIVNCTGPSCVSVTAIAGGAPMAVLWPLKAVLRPNSGLTDPSPEIRSGTALGTVRHETPLRR